MKPQGSSNVDGDSGAKDTEAHAKMFLPAKSEQDIRQRLLKKQNDIENEIAVYMSANTLVKNDSSRPRGLSRSKSTKIKGRPGIDFKMDEEEEEDKVAAEVIKKPSYPLEDEEDEKEQQEQAEVKMEWQLSAFGSRNHIVEAATLARSSEGNVSTSPVTSCTLENASKNVRTPQA